MVITHADLRLRAERWHHLFEAIPKSYFCFLLSRDGIYLAVRTPDPTRLWKPEAEHLGKRLEEVLPTELSCWRRIYFDHAVATGHTQVYSYPHPFKGRERSFECEITPLPDPISGQINEVLMTVRDIVVSPVPESFVVR
jgi:PAS domain-containing protein